MTLNTSTLKIQDDNKPERYTVFKLTTFITSTNFRVAVLRWFSLTLTSEAASAFPLSLIVFSRNAKMT